MVGRLHGITRTALTITAALAIAACGGGEGGDDPKREPKQQAPQPLRPTELTQLAKFDPGGENPISTELQEVADDTWLLTYGTQTKTNGLDSDVAISRDDGRTWKVLPTGRTFKTKGPDAFNSVTSIGDTWVLAGVWGRDTPADDPYLPTVWTSTDEGASWTRTVLPVLPKHNGIINEVVRWEDALYAVGQFQPDDGRAARTGAVWRSTDGTTWKIVGSGEMFAGGRAEVYIMDVATSDDGIVAVGAMSRAGDSQAARDAMPVVWTSRDGMTWNERVDLERPFSNATGAAIGGPDGDQLLVVGDAGRDERTSPWLEVMQLAVRGDKLLATSTKEQQLISSNPRTYTRGMPGTGAIRGIGWNAGQWIAAVTPNVGDRGNLTLWRSTDAQEFTPLGPDDQQPRIEFPQMDALGDLELRDGLLLTTGRLRGTTTVQVLGARSSN